MIALGIDPGGITGAAMWGDDGYVWSTSGTPEIVASKLARHPKLAEVFAFAVEDTFVNPKQPRGGLVTEGNASWIIGALWMTPLREVTREVWRPSSTQWRKAMGWPRMSGADAKDEARRHARIVTGEPWFDAKKSSHEAEAICMAEVAYQRRLG